jgi:hypothetical protein
VGGGPGERAGIPSKFPSILRSDPIATDRAPLLGYLNAGIPHKHLQIKVTEEIMTDIQIHTDPEIVEVVRRIDSLRSTENVSLEEKIRIAELVLSILEERKKDDVVVQ